MAETITVTVPELPLVSAPNGDELIAVWDQGRLSRIPQGALRGTRTYSGFGDPPATPSEIMALSPVPVLDDRWRNPETGDEWKVTSLDPFVWTPDGNVKGADGASTVPGPPGAPGERGATGPSGRTLTKTAGETIPDWRAVILDTNGQFRLADPSNPTHRQRVVGVVPYGGSGLATLVAQTAGDVTGPASNFNPAAALFVGSGGLLTSTPPDSGWRQIVATAVSSSQIVVALGEARVVADEGTALVIPDGGFSSPATAADIEAGEDSSKFVTPAALSEPLSGKLGLAAFLQAAAAYNQAPSNKTILDWLADLMIEGSDLRSLGFIGDGNSHPLSERFGAGSAGLAAAKSVFPRAVSLTEEIDGHAIQRRLDLAVAGNYGACIVLPRGSTALTSFAINSTATIACRVSSPGPACIKAVGTATGAWVHGTAENKATGRFKMEGIRLDTSSSATNKLGLSTYFGSSGVGRAHTLTVTDIEIYNFNRGWVIGNAPRGITVHDVNVYGIDNVIQTGAGITIIADASLNYGSFSYVFDAVQCVGYAFAFVCQCVGDALEGLIFNGCRSYGHGFLQYINTRPGFYYGLLITLNDCDWEGTGIGMDVYRARGVTVNGGYWIGRAPDANSFIQAGVVTDNGELRHFNFRDVFDFNLYGVMMDAAGPGDGSVRTNFVFVHTDAACKSGRIRDTGIITDHATATCAFRLSGSKAAAIMETGTRLTNWWGNPPVVLYAGTGDQPYQVSASDVAANNGTVSDEGYYRFSGVNVVTTDSQGRATISLPRRAGGVLPFFRLAPTVFPVSGNATGPVPSVSVIGSSSTAFTVVAAGAAPNVTLAIYWEASGF